jgi:hypothetical protein
MIVRGLVCGRRKLFRRSPLSRSTRALGRSRVLGCRANGEPKTMVMRTREIRQAQCGGLG